MGNEILNLPADPRIERCMRTFQIPPHKIMELWKIYRRFDFSEQGMMIMEDFFLSLLDYPRSPLTDAIPGFFDTKSEAFITLGEFVDVVCSIACMEQMELIKFVWYILDPRKVGTIETHEIKVFLYRIWHNKPYANVPEALAFLQTIDEDGVYNYRELALLRTRYPFVFYPVYKLQQHVLNRTLGESWWTAHKVKLADARHLKLKQDKLLAEKLKREKKAALDGVSDDMIRHRMGLRYYVFPWMIPKERKRLLKIAAVEADLERQFLRMEEECSGA